MDSLRTKKSNKKPWIIGGSITVGVIILIIVLSVTLSSSAEQDTGVTVKTVPEALKFVEEAVNKTYEKHDTIKKPLVKDINVLKARLTLVEDLFKAKTHAEENGQAYDIKIIEEKMASVDFVESEKTGEILKVDKKPEAKTTTKEAPVKTDGSEKTTEPATKEAASKDSAATAEAPKNLQGEK